MRKIFKNCIFLLGGFILLLVVMNWSFFWQNLKFTLGVIARNEETKQSSEIAAHPSGARNDTVVLAPNILKIESLGIETPVVYVDQATETAYQAGLKNGVVHFPGTAMPGEVGNVYIFGHSSDYLWSDGKYKTVFALLPRIETDAEISLSDSAGKIFEYKVLEKFVAGAHDVQYLSQDTNGEKILTLQTSYPIGTALKRYIVRATLVE